MTPFVRIHDLCLHLNGRAILHHVDLELPRHGISVLLGRSGSGKTSFLRCLNRLHDCTKDSRMQGQVELLLDGEMRDISRLRGEEALSRLRRQVGMVFQTPNVLPASIGQNLLLPLQLAAGLDMDEARSRARRSLEDVGLWPEVHDRLGDPAGSLSGGQQQRLCLARTLALEPQILLLDEPSTRPVPAASRICSCSFRNVTPSSSSRTGSPRHAVWRPDSCFLRTAMPAAPSRRKSWPASSPMRMRRGRPETRGSQSTPRPAGRCFSAGRAAGIMLSRKKEPLSVTGRSSNPLQGSVMSAAIRNPLPLWGLYFLLLVAMFATPLSNLSFLLWIIAPLLALTIRNSARKEGLEDDAQHASWIMGSAGLFLLLVFLLIGGMATASSTLIGAESQQRINEISTAMSRQQMPWKDAFVQLLEVQGVKGMILICAGGLLLSVLWPLQRILQGMVALKMQVAPRRISTGGKLLTLLLAVLLAGVSCLAALGATL